MKDTEEYPVGFGRFVIRVDTKHRSNDYSIVDFSDEDRWKKIASYNSSIPSFKSEEVFNTLLEQNAEALIVFSVRQLINRHHKDPGRCNYNFVLERNLASYYLRIDIYESKDGAPPG